MMSGAINTEDEHIMLQGISDAAAEVKIVVPLRKRYGIQPSDDDEEVVVTKPEAMASKPVVNFLTISYRTRTTSWVCHRHCPVMTQASCRVPTSQAALVIFQLGTSLLAPSGRPLLPDYLLPWHHYPRCPRLESTSLDHPMLVQ